MNKKRILLLNGSMRKKSTSLTIAKAFKEIIEKKGHKAQIIDVIDYFDNKDTIENLKELIANSDIIGMIAPCYVNTLPYADIWCLEKLVYEYQGEWKGKGFFAIAQGGMPDKQVHQSILDTSKHFAEETEMEWLGGLIIGMAPIINGAPLENFGFIGKKIIKGFDGAVEDIINDKVIASSLQKGLTINIPKVLYYPLSYFLNLNTKKTLKQNGVTDPYRQPYAE